ncbi:MAG TPA: ferritin-like domain-containing protein [Edaphocola sp.]|nr:ferritin-like domain-containing protein [Edaphocola sp.]
MENTLSKSGKTKENEINGPLHQFFVDALKDIYWVEKQLVKVLQKMEEAATTDELKEAFEDHLYITKKHVRRLNKVFKLIEEQPSENKCEAMEGLIKEGEAVIKKTEEGTMTRDAALVIAAQKVEHYEIATYGGLVALAKTMGHETAACLLEQTLDEEEETDRNLTELAETYINFEAQED